MVDRDGSPPTRSTLPVILRMAASSIPPYPHRSGKSKPNSLETSVYGEFLRGMNDFGYIEGRDFVMEWRFVAGDFSRLPEMASDLVARQVDVIIAGFTGAAHNQPTTFPVVELRLRAPGEARGLKRGVGHPRIRACRRRAASARASVSLRSRTLP